MTSPPPDAPVPDLFPAFTARDLIRMATSSTDTFIVPGLVSESVTLWYGQSEIGKSRFVVGFIAAMLRGQAFLGRAPAEPLRRISILTADAAGEREYARRLCRDDGAWAALTEEEIAGVSIVPLPQMAGPGHWAMLRTVLDRLDPQLVIIDPLSNVINGDPNMAGPVAEVFRGVRALGRPTIIVAHSSSKPTEHGRRRGSQTPLGHSSIVGSSRWRVEMLPDSTGELGRLICTGNDGPRVKITLGRGERLTDFHVVEESTAHELAAASVHSVEEAEVLHREAATWLVANHAGVASKAEASRLLAGQFPGLTPRATEADKRARSVAAMLSRQQGVGALLTFDSTGVRLARRLAAV